MSARILLPALLLASGLPAVTSCDKVPAGEQPGDTPIAFNSAVSTKAPVESENAMTEFAVWAAYYSNDVLESEPFVNTKVYKATDGTWTYYGLKFWQEGDWHFEAFYPLPSTLHVEKPVHGQDALKVSFTAQKTEEQSGIEGLSIEYYYGPTASHDLMTAEDTRTYSSASPDASPVQFEFKHLLSRVSIAVKTATDDVTLKSLTFAGMSVLGAYNTVGYSGRWQLLTEFDELSDVPSGSFSDLNDNIPSPLPSDGTSVDVLSDLLLIPQTPGVAQVEVTYTIGADGAGAGASETKSLTLPADPAWQPGRHYRYTLTLGTADVTLNIDVVKWTPEDYTVEW